ncbi:hypothetical protein RSAG8_07214, partial [Rhizoctonia solani AG-8 WAC10335]
MSCKIVPLTPNLQKLVIVHEGNSSDITLNVITRQALRLCATGKEQYVSFIGTGSNTHPSVYRFHFTTSLIDLQINLPQLKELHLGLNLYLASLTRSNNPSNLFQRLENLQSLSAHAHILVHNLGSLIELGRLPNLLRLNLWDWRHSLLRQLMIPSGKETLFPKIQEIIFKNINSDQVSRLLSSILPPQLETIELFIEDPDEQTDVICLSLVKHRNTLQSLKLARDHLWGTALELSEECLTNLFSLEGLHSLELVGYQAQNLELTGFSTSWTKLYRLNWLDQPLEPRQLGMLATSKPLLQELAIATGCWYQDGADRWHQEELPPPGVPVLPQHKHPISADEAREHWYSISQRSMHFTSRFELRNLDRDVVESVAR